ncbi:MAG: hypothetical protein NTY51_01820 [Deltaproteobacteria bacterium]|nr:hypothetical protein [Deltaproteobacteria bacterium]
MTKKNKSSELIRWSGILAGVFCLLILIVVFYQSYIYWNSLKNNSPGWIGRTHREDSRLGYVPIPGTSGLMVLSGGSQVSVHYDSRGFRTDLENSSKTFCELTSTRKFCLGLGCSFTFGFGIPGESTFCSLVADKLGMAPLNAGRCSYGLAEMLILAREIIREFKPEIVLVQYSPWLVDRSQQRYGPTFHGLLPHPYFLEARGDELVIHKPDFQSMIFDNDLAKFRLSDHTFLDFVRFSINIEIPLFFHDLWNAGLVRIKELSGLSPSPWQNSEKITRKVYAEIAAICKKHGAKMVLVVLGMDNTIPAVPESLEKLNVKIVNAQLGLIERLKINSTEEYANSYYHWAGDPPKVVDMHPNVGAHEIIAATIVDKHQHKQSLGIKNRGTE